MASTHGFPWKAAALDTVVFLVRVQMSQYVSTRGQYEGAVRGSVHVLYERLEGDNRMGRVHILESFLFYFLFGTTLRVVFDILEYSFKVQPHITTNHQKQLLPKPGPTMELFSDSISRYNHRLAVAVGSLCHRSIRQR